MSAPLFLLRSALFAAFLAGCGGEEGDAALEAAAGDPASVADAASAESAHEVSAREERPICGSTVNQDGASATLAKVVPGRVREILGWENDRTIDFRARVKERQENVDGFREILENARLTQEQRISMERLLANEKRLLRRAQEYLADPTLLRREQKRLVNSMTGSKAHEERGNADGHVVSDEPMVSMRTSFGDLWIELFPQEAPETVANFLQYVEDGFYDCAIFHRVVRGFVVQGGGLTADMVEKDTRPPIRNEATNGLLNRRGTLAMARTGDPHSASSQFFVNTNDNAMLNHTAQDRRGWGYAVFGRVISGMETVDRIEASPVVSRNGHDDVPFTPVVIESATVVSR